MIPSGYLITKTLFGLLITTPNLIDILVTNPLFSVY